MTLKEREKYVAERLHYVASNYNNDSLHIGEWKIEIGNTPNLIMGRCIYESKKIIISNRIVCDDAFKDTVNHELAHILQPNGRHDKVWRKYAVELGATPRARARVGLKEFDRVTKDPKWLVVWKVKGCDQGIEIKVVGKARRKLKHMESRYVEGNKELTHGFLYLIEKAIYEELNSDLERASYLVR